MKETAIVDPDLTALQSVIRMLQIEASRDDEYGFHLEVPGVGRFSVNRNQHDAVVRAHLESPGGLNGRDSP